MSAGKLSRFIGLVFVLVALFGGVGASVAGAEHGTGGAGTVAVGDVNAGGPSNVRSEALIISTFDYDWH
jgi:hypothetical protein